MPCGLINALPTFCTHMNKVLALFLDYFVVVHLDDNVIYNKFLEKHVGRLWEEFQSLRDNELYVKK